MIYTRNEDGVILRDGEPWTDDPDEMLKELNFLFVNVHHLETVINKVFKRDE